MRSIAESDLQRHEWQHKRLERERSELAQTITAEQRQLERSLRELQAAGNRTIQALKTKQQQLDSQLQRLERDIDRLRLAVEAEARTSKQSTH